MPTYSVTLFREATDLLKATVEVEVDSTDHETIVAKAVEKARNTNLEWSFDQSGECGPIQPELTDTCDVRELADLLDD